MRLVPCVRRGEWDGGECVGRLVLFEKCELSAGEKKWEGDWRWVGVCRVTLQ